MMTKLKKKSRTMAYAEGDSPPHQGTPSQKSSATMWSSLQPRSNNSRANAVGHHSGTIEEPVHRTELVHATNSDDQKRQYWAARALQAETMLRIREVHYQDMRNEVDVQTQKREKELAALSMQHHDRHASLERLIYTLIVVVVALVLVVIYQTNLYSWNHHLDTKRGRWTTPAHFTIPILSPFTSVVEHESSVISSKTIALLICVFGCVVYMTFRYWISRR